MEMISLRKIKGVVFDFDGTIAFLTIDFAQMRRQVLSHLQSFGVDPEGVCNLYILEMIAAGKRLIARQYPGQAERYEQQALDLIRNMEVIAARQGGLLPGIREMFFDLQELGIKTGLVTRNCREAVEHIFPDIDAFVPIVLTRDDTPRVKPDPDHLKRVLHVFSLPASLTAMVGDHKMDMVLAKDVGVMAIGVLTGHDSAEDLEKAGADLIIARASTLSNAWGKDARQGCF